MTEIVRELIRDLRTGPIDSSLCHAAADELEEMLATQERIEMDRQALDRAIATLIRIQGETEYALNSMTCAGERA